MSMYHTANFNVMQALEYVSLLARHGSDALIKYDANPLAWEEVQALAGPGTIGLTLGCVRAIQSFTNKTSASCRAPALRKAC